jgi:prepilin-type N-terminal cleavage/methylation domain-containing protein
MKNTERGFSLIEVLIAMVILTIGVIGLAATSRAITQMSGSGIRSAESAALANARLDVLRATDCAALTSGSETVGAYTLAWRVRTHATYSQLREVELVVRYNEPGSTRTALYETQISCASPVA